MNSIVEQILKEEFDSVLPKLKEHHDKLAARVLTWLKNKDKILPVLQAFQVLGASIETSYEWTAVRIAGDKELFIKCWKLWRSIGCRLDAVRPGATEITQFLSPYGFSCFFMFTSTVCKRIKVGTKMVEQDIYETHCGTDLSTIEVKELEAPSGELVPTDDDIPF